MNTAVIEKPYAKDNARLDACPHKPMKRRMPERSNAFVEQIPALQTQHFHLRNSS